jgi:hypothetical protein
MARKEEKAARVKRNLISQDQYSDLLLDLQEDFPE